MNKAARLNMLILDKHGIPRPIEDHWFHPTRKWEIDYAWPDWPGGRKLALEIQGGVFMRGGGGGHNRGAHYLEDLRKHTALAEFGWFVVYFTPSDIEKGLHIAVLERMMVT